MFCRACQRCTMSISRVCLSNKLSSNLAIKAITYYVPFLYPLKTSDGRLILTLRLTLLGSL